MAGGCACKGGLGCRLRVIATYDCDAGDSALNLTLVVVGLLALVLVTRRWPEGIPFAGVVVLGFTALQFGLCLALGPEDGCQGVSIIWSGLAGVCAALLPKAGFSARQPCGPREPKLGWDTITPIVVEGFLLSSLSAVLFYAVTEDPITTVAHVCAAVLGALIGIWPGRRL